MERQAGPPSREIYTLKGVKDFMKSNFDEPVILGVFEDENDPMLKLYYEANQELRDDYSFGHTFEKEVKKLVGVEGSAIVVVHPVHLRSEYEPKYRIFKVRIQIFTGVFFTIRHLFFVSLFVFLP